MGIVYRSGGAALLGGVARPWIPAFAGMTELGVAPGMGSRLHGNDGCVHGESPSLLRGRGGRRAAGDGFPFARERRLAWGVTLTPSRERGTACRRGWVPVCTGTTGVCGESPSPQPYPVKGEGQACRRGWVPASAGTTVGMGESPSPQPSPVEGEGDGVAPGMGSRLHGNDGVAWGVTLTPALSRRGRGGRRGAGDGFPSPRERRLAWGVTLTPTLSRQGRGGSRPRPGSVGGRLSPLPSRERGTACRRGWVPVCTGTTVGMGSHPHPSPLPSRERGQAPSHPPPAFSHRGRGGFRTQPRPLGSRPRLRGGMPKRE